MPNTKPFQLSTALLTWFDQHGRQHLPWQSPITPYRVWLSEIMLQQTQVDTVIPYFNRFISTFETIHDLAQADIEQVLHLWTGLGYYARARNLHKCAVTVVDEYNGEIPNEPEQLIALPGIGKSTAHAITSIAFGKPTAILDGNVKRVLARFHATPGWPGTPKVEKVLWKHAEAHMPNKRCGDYTQAIMDLGATLCTRSKPQCELCPLAQKCQAYSTQSADQYPGKKPKKLTPIKETTLLIAQNKDSQILLEKRPPKGIWGGLWSFREFGDEEAAHSHCLTLGKTLHSERWSAFQHVFSHYKLTIRPVVVQLAPNLQIREGSNQHNETEQRWVTPDEALNLGLPAPIKRIIEQLQSQKDLLV